MSTHPDQSQPDYQIEYRNKSAGPTRSREHKWTRSSRKNARRKSNTSHTTHNKAGMHKRRNRRMSW
jgi:hypothetical protein